MSSHKSGVDTPDRFMTHYEPPHAVSQRHLVDKLHAAEVELGRKENEDGQRDHIRSEASEMRTVDGQHMIPSGRNLVDSSPLTTEPEGEGVASLRAERTPKPKSGRSRSKTRRPEEMERRESKAKAFAFFGQVSRRAFTHAAYGMENLTSAGRFGFGSERGGGFPLTIMTMCINYRRCLCIYLSMLESSCMIRLGPDDGPASCISAK